MPELFAIRLGAFLLGKYAHLQRAYVDVQQQRWQRIGVDGALDQRGGVHIGRSRGCRVGHGGAGSQRDGREAQRGAHELHDDDGP